MRTSSQLDILNLAASAFVMAGVAVTVGRAVGLGTPPRLQASTHPVSESSEEAEHHSIPWEDKRRLIEKYGKWAVDMAEGYCPHNDVACVEREAKRFQEVFRYRRGT